MDPFSRQIWLGNPLQRFGTILLDMVFNCHVWLEGDICHGATFETVFPWHEGFGHIHLVTNQLWNKRHPANDSNLMIFHAFTPFDFRANFNYHEPHPYLSAGAVILNLWAGLWFPPTCMDHSALQPWISIKLDVNKIQDLEEHKGWWCLVLNHAILFIPPYDPCPLWRCRKQAGCSPKSAKSFLPMANNWDDHLGSPDC